MPSAISAGMQFRVRDTPPDRVGSARLAPSLLAGVGSIAWVTTCGVAAAVTAVVGTAVFVGAGVDVGTGVSVGVLVAVGVGAVS